MEKCLEMLKTAMETGELVEVYSDPENTDQFGAGYVVAMDEDSIIQRHIHPSGCDDGYSWRTSEKIYRVNIQTRYLECLEMLLDQENQPVFAQNGEETLSAQLLRFAMEYGMVVRIELHDSDRWDVMGLVKEVGENVIVEMLNVEGETDGIAAVRLENITEFSCGDDYENKIGRLFRLRNGQK